MNYQDYIDCWKLEQSKLKLSVYDDCMKCNKEARLLNGLCFECWKSQLQKEVILK
jgi:hypothetical protein